MNQAKPRETSADDSQNSGNHQSGVAGDWMRVLALVVVAALILRFDYSALDFSNLFSNVPSAFGFSSQPKAADSPLVPAQAVQPFDSTYGNLSSRSNACDQHSNIRYPIVENRSVSRVDRENCH